MDCGKCIYFGIVSGVRYCLKLQYQLPYHPDNDRICRLFKPSDSNEEKKPEEGDYCKRKIVEIIKYKGEIWPCSTCDVRCPHSYKKEEIDFLVKKNKKQ